MVDQETATKRITIGDRMFTIQGLGSNDPYFRSLEDGFEPDFEALARTFVRDDYVCIDIGANIGIKSILLAQIASRGRVIAIEPGPNVARLLEVNIAHSGMSNVSVVQAAVSDRVGVLHFAGDSAYGHIAASGAEVAATTLGDIVTSNGLKRLDFVKIDVEGFEFPILKSSLEILNEHRSLVLFEFNPWCQMVMGRFNPADLIEWVGANFSHLYVVHKTLNKSFVLEHVENANCLKILEDVLKNGWLVIDLLVTNAEDRLSQTIIPYTIIAQSDVRSPEVADDELYALNQRIATLNAELDAQRSARQAAEAAQVAAEAAMNAAEAARVAAETAMNAACARLLIMDGTLESMHASMSWRLTAPLRGFASRHPRFVQGVLAFIERHPWLGRDAVLLARNIWRIATLRPVIRRTPLIATADDHSRCVPSPSPDCNSSSMPGTRSNR
jgi:FkbM family methyltransferase